jgi:hypothetical protein
VPEPAIERPERGTPPTPRLAVRISDTIFKLQSTVFPHGARKLESLEEGGNNKLQSVETLPASTPTIHICNVKQITVLIIAENGQTPATRA